MMNNEDLKHSEEVLDDAYCAKLLEKSRNDPERQEFSSFDDFVCEYEKPRMNARNDE